MIAPGAVLIVVATAYCASSDYAHGRTASGPRPVEGYTIACDPTVLPLGTSVSSPALRPWLPTSGGRLVCEDTGRLIKGRRIDVRIDDCARARLFGRRRVAMRVHSVPRSRTCRRCLPVRAAIPPEHPCVGLR